MNAIILHGMPGKDEYFDTTVASASNSHWLPWLQNELLTRGIAAQTPDILDAWRPDYQLWSREFERYDITPQTILAGHSCGAGFIVQWLSEHTDVRVAKVVLVAPWLGDTAGTWQPEVTGGFFEFEIDKNLTERVGSLTIIGSDNDYPFITSAVARLREALPRATYREFHNYGHFCYSDMQTQAFPELLETVLP